MLLWGVFSCWFSSHNHIVPFITVLWFYIIPVSIYSDFFLLLIYESKHKHTNTPCALQQVCSGCFCPSISRKRELLPPLTVTCRQQHLAVKAYTRKIHSSPHVRSPPREHTVQTDMPLQNTHILPLSHISSYRRSCSVAVMYAALKRGHQTQSLNWPECPSSLRWGGQIFLWWTVKCSQNATRQVTKLSCIMGDVVECSWVELWLARHVFAVNPSSKHDSLYQVNHVR